VTQATYATNLVNSWSYDAAGRLARQWGTGYAAGAQTSDAYAYDIDTGEKTADNVQLAYGGTIAASYTYDPDGRLDVATIGGLASDHGFDGAGNLTSVVSGGTTTAFLYDSANRLTQKNLNGVVNTKYKWNASYGWRTSQGPSDASQPVTYAYTASGRLATYGDATRSLTATYSYDAAGQRTRAVVTQSGTTTTTDYRYDGLTLLGFTVTQGSASWRLDYLYDETGSLYGGIYRDPATSATATVFGLLATDRGDVVALLDVSGNAFCAYRYDAWGVPTATTTQATGLINSTLAANIAARQLLRYASYCYDSESALYYCSARSYDPATRQWISSDPAEADGEESAFQYCGGEPVGGVDPTGEETFLTFTRAEWDLMLRHPDKILPVRRARDFAVRRTQACAGKGWFTPYSVSHNGKGDAFRHATWNAVMSQDIGIHWAERFATAHEYPTYTDRASRMDLHNNLVGRSLYLEYRSMGMGMRSWWISEQVNRAKGLRWFGHKI